VLKVQLNTNQPTNLPVGWNRKSFFHRNFVLSLGLLCMFILACWAFILHLIAGYPDALKVAKNLMFAALNCCRIQAFIISLEGDKMPTILHLYHNVIITTLICWCSNSYDVRSFNESLQGARLTDIAGNVKQLNSYQLWKILSGETEKRTVHPYTLGVTPVFSRLLWVLCCLFWGFTAY